MANNVYGSNLEGTEINSSGSFVFLSDGLSARSIGWDFRND